MDNVIRLAGPNHSMELFGVRPVGVNARAPRSCSSAFFLAAALMPLGR